MFVFEGQGYKVYFGGYQNLCGIVCDSDNVETYVCSYWVNNEDRVNPYGGGGTAMMPYIYQNYDLNENGIFDIEYWTFDNHFKDYRDDGETLLFKTIQEAWGTDDIRMGLAHVRFWLDFLPTYLPDFDATQWHLMISDGEPLIMSEDSVSRVIEHIRGLENPSIELIRFMPSPAQNMPLANIPLLRLIAYVDGITGDNVQYMTDGKRLAIMGAEGVYTFYFKNNKVELDDDCCYESWELQTTPEEIIELSKLGRK